ncbi:MAG: hypothetical protein K6E86_06940 [Bacteroidales bacterium]|nr:hypothetical protein [Bacteroidales bacterium]
MITFFILCIVASILIVKAANNKKRSPQEEEERREEIAKLPDIYLNAKTLTSGEKALNLWPRDVDVLQTLEFKSGTNNIYLKMKDGRSILCDIDDLEMHFSKTNGVIRFEARYNGTGFSFYQYAYYFSDKEWDIIINLLSLAGTTHGAYVLGSAFKNIKRAQTAMKIIKALNSFR